MKPSGTFGWPDSAIVMLRELWGTMTTREIGALISARYGTEVSGNAVIGKAGRLRLARHENPIGRRNVHSTHPPRDRRAEAARLAIRKAGKTIRPVVAAPALVHLPVPPLPRVTMKPVLRPTTEMCQWTDSVYRPWLFCGKPVVTLGCAWCAEHRKRVFQARRVEEAA